MDKVHIAGRQPIPWTKKVNPIWWVRNSDDPIPPDWYPHGPVMWWFRNPFHNFMFYVVGVADRNYTVYGRKPADLSVRMDIGETGYQWSFIMAGGWLPLPWISYSGTKIVWYIGWQPSGKLGAKFNILKSV